MNEKLQIFLKAMGKVIKEQREKMGITREQFAKRVDMTVEEIIDLENGKLKTFTEEDLKLFYQFMIKPNYAKKYL